MALNEGHFINSLFINPTFPNADKQINHYVPCEGNKFKTFAYKYSYNDIYLKTFLLNYTYRGAYL